MTGEGMNNQGYRHAEWFVPQFGSLRLRTFLGLLFLPYTGMVLSFTVIGSLLAEDVLWERVWAILIIYFFGLGIGAHSLDALGSKGSKPWGTVFTRFQLWLLAAGSLIIAYAVGIYYIVRHVPLLTSTALLEGFFVFAYNLEWFQGRFHKDGWFSFSWGFLPVLSGFIMQTNSISLGALLLGAAMGFFSLIEITASRPYKELKRRWPELGQEEKSLMVRYEAILKSVSLGVILLGGGLLIRRTIG